MRLIDADIFIAEMEEELENDVNMYNSHIEKEIRDDKYRFAIECVNEQPTVKPDVLVWNYVKDGNPKLTGTYFVVNNFGDMCSCEYHIHHGWATIFIEDVYADSDVIAWAELPERPKYNYDEVD